MQKDCEIINIIQQKKLQYLGHIMRGPKYTLLQLIVQGKISGVLVVLAQKFKGLAWLQ